MTDGLGVFARDDRAKAYRGGTHRAVPPQDTLDRLRPHFRRIGLTRLSDVTGLDTIGLPVAQAVRPLARNLSVNQGKGLTRAEARASAAMEAAESWHAEQVVAAATGSAETMRRRGPIVEPGDMVADLSRSGAANCATIQWVRGCDLTTGAGIWVPLDCVGMDYASPPDCGLIARSSNGLASGNTRAEALAAALCEVIERDAFSRFRDLSWKDRNARLVRHQALWASRAKPLVAAIRAAGFFLEVWDITSALGVPSFHATISAPAETTYRLPPCSGSGCHLDPDIALSRAVTEAAQARLTLIAGSRDDIVPEDYAPRPEEHVARLGTMMFADAAGCELPRCNRSGESSLEDAAVLRDRLRAGGFPVIAFVDLTDPAIGLPVCRVVVPGLSVIAGPGRFRSGRPIAGAPDRPREAAPLHPGGDPALRPRSGSGDV